MAAMVFVAQCTDSNNNEFNKDKDDMVKGAYADASRFKRAVKCHTEKATCLQSYCNQCCESDCQGIGCMQSMCDKCCGGGIL